MPSRGNAQTVPPYSTPLSPGTRGGGRLLLPILSKLGRVLASIISGQWVVGRSAPCRFQAGALVGSMQLKASKLIEGPMGPAGGDFQQAHGLSV